MALPTNDHHVHSDGYYSDKGEPDPERMMEEMADEVDINPSLDGLDAFAEVGANGPYVVVEGNVMDCADGLQLLAEDWGCRVTTLERDYAEIRLR